jgi:signal transduction histidine kinase
MELKTEKIRTYILVPVALALFLLLMVSILSVYLLQQRNMLEDINHAILEVQELYPRFLNSEAHLLESLIDSFKQNEKLQNAWMAKDRKLLLKDAEDIFSYMRSKYNVTHFYFIDREKECFLRVHNPGRYGDTIDRFTLEKSIRQGVYTHGVELGPFGTFTLRFVYPWIINNRLSGYIELGKEIDHLAPAIKSILGVELFFSIDKQFLNRKAWEEGLRMLKHSGDWDEFDDVIVAHRSIEKIPVELVAHHARLKKEHAEVIVKTEIFDRDYYAGFLPLTDAGGNIVGDIIVLNDTTDEEASFRKSFITQTVVCLIISVLLFLFFYTYVGRIQDRLITARYDLIETKEALFRKEKLAELGKLASGLGQELRNPLGVIKNACYYLDMKKSLIEDEAVRENITIINRQTVTATTIVTNILDFARTKKPERQDVDMNRLVTDALSGVSLPENITVNTLFAGDLHAVSLDPGQVGQIVSNLIENAIHAMKDGGTLAIETRQYGTTTEVIVTDSGCGIPVEDLGEIFEPLYTSKKEGLGLGLALSQSFAEANGGIILVESKEGRGSTFTLRFGD